MRAIASEPENRFDWWIMKTFSVLPTDSRFQDLTPEQKELLWEHFLIDNPEIERKLKNRFEDPDFDKALEALDPLEAPQKPSQDVLKGNEYNDDQDDYSLIEANYEAFIKSDKEVPDYKETLAKKGVILENENLDNDNDWEEVDD